jgi:hypothetical protein
MSLHQVVPIKDPAMHLSGNSLDMKSYYYFEFSDPVHSASHSAKGVESLFAQQKLMRLSSVGGQGSAPLAYSYADRGRPSEYPISDDAIQLRGSDMTEWGEVRLTGKLLRPADP